MESASKKLFLVFHGRFPSERAASIFAAKSAEAFALKDFKVTLVVPRRLGRKRGNQYSYYHIKNNFEIVYLPTIDLYLFPFPKKLSFWLSFISFSVSSFMYFLLNASREDIFYSNETLPLFLVSFVFPGVFYEMHDFPEGKFGFFNIFFRKMKWILIHNHWKTKHAMKQFEIPKRKIITEPNAVDVEDFDVPISKNEARDRLGLPRDKKIAVYTGHLYSWKGVDTLALASKELPENYLTVFVGGTEEDIKSFSQRYGNARNIKIVGWRPHEEIPVWQKVADVLILPNTAKENISKYYTSPMKFFEYAASRRPVVASNIPSIVELASDTRAFLVNPDDAGSLADGMKKVCEDEALTKNISESAYAWVLEHTWEKRAGRVVAFMNFQG